MRDESFFENLGLRLLAEAGPDGVMLLDRDFRIREVNSTFEANALRSRDELLGEYVFDAFPGSPDDPPANGVSQLEESLDTAVRRRGRHSMPIVRYDIIDPTQPDAYIPRLWTCDNTSVGEHDEESLGVIHRVSPINTLQAALSALARADADGAQLSLSVLLHVLSALTAATDTQADEWRAMKRDNDHLRRALENRDVIGQAKGIIMERYNVDAERAFDLLVKLSQESNLRVEKVARKLIEIDHPST